MSYISAQPSLGAWWDPFSWGGGTATDPRALKIAGDIRYCKQLEMWTRQTRAWFNQKLQLARDANNTAAKQAIATALADLIKVENQLAPSLQQIATAERQAMAAGNQPPAQWPLLWWDGWEGTAAKPPAAPPAARPLTADEVKNGLGAASSPSYFLYALGAVVIAVGIVIALPLSISAIVLGIITMGIGSVLAMSGSAGGQEALKDTFNNISQPLGLMLPIIIGGAALLLLNGRGRGRSNKS